MNPYEGRLPPGWEATPVRHSENSRGMPAYTIRGKNTVGKAVCFTAQIDETFPLESILRSCWIKHLIPGVEESPGRLSLRNAGFSKYWRLPPVPAV